ncbi:NAD(P)/FAD-dependent oxidoreductase [bacterium]|nr:NAD(P)/FAD-dependent oxidoreductase [bacterium]
MIPKSKYDVIVVGAGVAGCLFSRNLARAGFSVCLFEKKAESELGYKWWDSVIKTVFDEVSLSHPSGEELYETGNIHFYSPSREFSVFARDTGKTYAVNRRKFGQRLLQEAIDAGAEFHEMSEVLEPEADVVNKKIIGVTVKGIGPVCADLTVDCSGLKGIIRSQIPFETEISKDIVDKDIFHTYREIRRKRADYTDERFIVCFGKDRGMNWVSFRQEGLVDFFAGRMGGQENCKPSRETVAELVEKFKYGCDAEIIAGGFEEGIPVRRPLDSFVENSLMVIGNAACQCHPVFGAGIASSLYGAHIASDTAIQALERKVTTKEKLWAYNVKYHRSELNQAFTFFDVIREFVLRLSESQIEFLLASRIVDIGEVWGKKELQTPRGFNSAIKLLLKGKKRLPLMLKLKKCLKRADRARGTCTEYPIRYTPETFSEWRKKIKSCYIK